MYVSNSHTLPRMPSPNLFQPASSNSQPNINFPAHAHTLQYPSSRNRPLPEDPSRKYMVEHMRNSQDVHHSYYNQHPHHYMMPPPAPQGYKPQVDSAHTYGNMNNHPLLAHQQYEPEVIQSATSSTGLGGHWVKTEGGEMIWCATLLQDDDVSSTWQADKRYIMVTVLCTPTDILLIYSKLF